MAGDKHYALVVDDPEKHHAFVKGVNAHHHKSELRRREGREPMPHEHRRIDRAIDERFPAPQPAGSLHTHTESLDCPDGLPNCRNCGDPAFATRCRTAGHCPHCGVHGPGGHGIIADAHVAAGGYRLVELTGEQARLAKRHAHGESEWDNASRQFLPREPVHPRAGRIPPEPVG